MELISIFYVALFLCVVSVVTLDFFTWRQVSKLKKHIGREQVTELFWELYTQAQTEVPPPVVNENQVQAMVLLALDRLGQLPVSEKPKENGHEPDADEILSHIVSHMPVVAALKPAVVAPKPVAAPVPQVTKVETASLMCKCGDGPFTEVELRTHIVQKKEKGKHGWPKKEKAQ